MKHRKIKITSAAELEKFLKNEGYKKVGGGNHTKWQNSAGHVLYVPHQHRTFSVHLGHGIQKEVHAFKSGSKS